MARRCDFTQVLTDHLSYQKFLTFQKFQPSDLPVVVKENEIYFCDQPIYRGWKSLRGQGILINQKPEGIWIYWWPYNQMWRRGRFVGGKEEGVWETWHSNGQISEKGRWIEWKVDGLWKTWYPNGQKSSRGHFVNGKKEGLWKTWSENGRKSKKRYYVSGKLIPKTIS